MSNSGVAEAGAHHVAPLSAAGRHGAQAGEARGGALAFVELHEAMTRSSASPLLAGGSSSATGRLRSVTRSRSPRSMRLQQRDAFGVLLGWDQLVEPEPVALHGFQCFGEFSARRRRSGGSAVRLFRRREVCGSQVLASHTSKATN